MSSHQPYGDRTDRTYLLLTARFRFRDRSLVDMLSYALLGRDSWQGRGWFCREREREREKRVFEACVESKNNGLVISERFV